MGYERKKRKSGKIRVSSRPNDNMNRWEVEEDLRSIARANACKACPDRMKKVKALAAEKMEESKRKKEEAQEMIELGQDA